MKTELPVLPTSPLPPLYAGWMDELLGGAIPPETDATCDDCAMLSPDAPHGSAEFFNPQTKCCAYVPMLPNFLVGRLLNDRDAAAAPGRATVVARLQAGSNVSPLGLKASPVFHRLYGGDVFGQSRALRCPHYLEEAGGQCGVWRNRNSVCVTWFCKHVRGATGHRLWQALRDLLATRGPATETLDRQNRLAQLKSESAALEQALAHTTITAPVAGVVTRLDVRNARAVVQSGQSVAAIAPSGARLVVEAQVPNKDIAFVEKGMAAKLKFDAFPFQDYGSVVGQVSEVALDAQGDERQATFYKVTITTQQTAVFAHGKNVPLRLGMALTVELVTERKSLLALLLEPFRKFKGEAGKGK